MILGYTSDWRRIIGCIGTRKRVARAEDSGNTRSREGIGPNLSLHFTRYLCVKMSLNKQSVGVFEARESLLTHTPSVSAATLCKIHVSIPNRTK